MSLSIFGLENLENHQQQQFNSVVRIANDTPNLLSVSTGNNVFTGTANNDQISGSDLPDIIHGMGGDDILSGINADDILYGGKDNDSLFGGQGNDVLLGNGGADVLTGAEGNDIFIVGRVNGQGNPGGNLLTDADVIKDFIKAEDKIVLVDGLHFDDVNITAQNGFTVIQERLTGIYLVQLDGEINLEKTDFIIYDVSMLTGLAGPQGPIGLTGPAGANGADGADGAVGPQGPIGLTSPVGPQGPIGFTGAVGPVGPAGKDGATGDTDPIGLTGATGLTRLTASIGPKGDSGIEGPIGLTGLLSVQGAQKLIEDGVQAIAFQNYVLAEEKLQEARQLFGQLSNLYRDLSSSFFGINNRLSTSIREQAVATAEKRDETTYLLAMVHKFQNQPELAVPLL